MREWRLCALDTRITWEIQSREVENIPTMRLALQAFLHDESFLHAIQDHLRCLSPYKHSPISHDASSQQAFHNLPHDFP